jgi:uncharacterized protein
MKASPAPNENLKVKTPPACAICGRPRVDKYNPFCSKRCADVDLYRWLNGKYAIPASEEPDAKDLDASSDDE